MASLKDWLNQKFIDWEKTQKGRQSYYAFARYLEVSQSGLQGWMIGDGAPDGDDLEALAQKLGPEVYEILGVPRPGLSSQGEALPLDGLPADIRQGLMDAVIEFDQAVKQYRLRPESPQSRQAALAILAKHGFRYTG